MCKTTFIIINRWEIQICKKGLLISYQEAFLQSIKTSLAGGSCLGFKVIVFLKRYRPNPSYITPCFTPKFTYFDI